MEDHPIKILRAVKIYEPDKPVSSAQTQKPLSIFAESFIPSSENPFRSSGPRDIHSILETSKNPFRSSGLFDLHLSEESTTTPSTMDGETIIYKNSSTYFKESNCTVYLIDTEDLLIISLEKLRAVSTIALDCEGVDLGSKSPSSSLAILHISTGRNSDVHCFDIFKLGASAFTTTTSDGYSLKTLLESNTVRKLLWDLRSDSSSLFRNYNITLAGAFDVQVQDTASLFLKQVKLTYDQRRILKNIYGLGSTLEKSRAISNEEKARLRTIKAEAKKFFSPDEGGTYENWNIRPLSKLLLEYCCDSRYFFSLFEQYDKVLRACLRYTSRGAYEMSQDALKRSFERRLAHSTSPDFDNSDRDIMCRVDRLLLLDLCEIIDIDPEAMKVPHFDIMKVKEEEEDKEDDDHGATIESNTIKTTDKTTDKSIEIINKSAPPESFGGFGAGAFPF
jgi:exonuclease 3'-5' domain-containing protein 1